MNLFDILELLCIFPFTAILIVLLIKFAPKLKLLDVPNHRSTHSKIIPRGAGIAMFLAVLISDAIFTQRALFGNLSTYIATSMVLIIGILDDRHNTSHRTKFIIIFLATIILYYHGIYISTLGKFFGHDLTLSWMALPFTIFAVTGFTNALNLIDGLDGLSSSISIIILATLGFIGYSNNDFFIVNLSLAMIVALGTFLLFNWNPAKIFMGDSGSLTIGFIISVLAIKALHYIQPTSILFITAIPIMDTIIVMIRRLRNGHSPFSPDKLHIHHLILNFFDGNVKKTVLFLIVLQLTYSVLGLNFSDYAYQRYVLVIFILNVTALYILLNGMIKDK